MVRQSSDSLNLCALRCPEVARAAGARRARNAWRYFDGTSWLNPKRKQRLSKSTSVTWQAAGLGPHRRLERQMAHFKTTYMVRRKDEHEQRHNDSV
jgi:hypothetical protein